MAKKEKKKYTSIGGQALMEGIMMRGPKLTTMAVRRMNGSVYTETTVNPEPSVWNKIPFVRGVVNFVQSMVGGSKVLMRSAEFVIEDEEKAEAEKAAAAAKALEQPNTDEAAPAEEAAAPAVAAVPEADDTADEANDANENDGIIEEIADKIEDTLEDIGEKLEAAGDKIDDALDTAAEKAADAFADFKSGIKDGMTSTPAEWLNPHGGETEKAAKKDKKAKKDSGGDMEGLTFISVVLGVVLAAVLFVFLPTWCYAGIMKIPGAEAIFGGTVWKSVIEGILKLIIFLLYLILCSSMKEIRRVFEYHGAEHKTIFCYEAGEELTVENVKKHSRFHPRCGTSFLVLTILVGMIAGICISAFLPQLDTVWLRPLIKIAILPVVMGVGYELLKLCGRFDNLFTRIIRAPGLWVQRITTREPDDSQIECAIAALIPVIPEDGEDMA